MKNKKKQLIGFNNCLSVTFDMELNRVMKITKSFQYRGGEEIKSNTYILLFSKSVSHWVCNWVHAKF